MKLYKLYLNLGKEFPSSEPPKLVHTVISQRESTLDKWFSSQNKFIQSYLQESWYNKVAYDWDDNKECFVDQNGTVIDLPSIEIQIVKEVIKKKYLNNETEYGTKYCLAIYSNCLLYDWNDINGMRIK